MNNGPFTYLAALLLFGSNGIIAAAIALPSSAIVLLRTFLGALSLVAILAITQRHKLQAPSRPREAAALLLSGAALGAAWIFCSVPTRRSALHLLAVVLLRPHHRYGPLPAHFWRKADRRQNRRLYRRCLRCFSHCSARSRWQYAIAGIACGIASAFCYALMVIASKGAPHIEGLENSTLQVSAAFVTALVLTLVTQGAPSFFSPGIAVSSIGAPSPCSASSTPA